MIVPCYNVESYIDQFFESVFQQTINHDCLEIVTVDDGSCDGTASRIADWSSRFPGRIHYIHQDNQGLASARNTGLDHATGTWVSFPDPDDFLSANYFECVDEEIFRPRTRELSMISCNVFFFRESIGETQNTHPLRYRFDAARTALPASDLDNYVQLAANSAFLKRSLIERHRLRFDRRIVPTFEDGHLNNLFLLLNPDTEIVFLRAPVYNYRKRASADSLVDKSKLQESWYIDQLQYGYLDLLHRAKQIAGRIPDFVQRTVLYDVAWRIYFHLERPERGTILQDRSRERFFALLKLIIDEIDARVINTFSATEKHRVALLALKGLTRPVTSVCLRQIDAAKGMVQLSYMSANKKNLAKVFINGAQVPLHFLSRRTLKLLQVDLIFEHFFWVALNRKDYLSIRVEGDLCVLKKGRKHLGAMGTLDAFLQAENCQLPDSKLPREIREVRRAATSSKARKQYRDCWLFIDRDDRADDNAEHLYRYLLLNGSSAKAFFVLRRESRDWSRLRREGFKLIPFGEPQHYQALINAKFLISSHADHYVLWPKPRDQIRDLVKYRYIFLQHGVTKDDCSRWLNKKPIARFITATHDEYASIVALESNYVVSSKETALTGLARHDRLWAIERRAETVLIMPTWRRYLAGTRLDNGNKRDRSKVLATSHFALRWRSLLKSEKLKAIADASGLKIVFCPHPNLAPDIDDFELPGHVAIYNPLTFQSFQEVFAETAVMITDFSSAAFDVAYLEKPIIYYQFDTEEVFGGGHVYEQGYYNYKKHGFGPVCRTERGVLEQLANTLTNEVDRKYARRRHKAFPYRDGRCCERIYLGILQLDEPQEIANSLRHSLTKPLFSRLRPSFHPKTLKLMG